MTLFPLEFIYLKYSRSFWLMSSYRVFLHENVKSVKSFCTKAGTDTATSGRMHRICIRKTKSQWMREDLWMPIRQRVIMFPFLQIHAEIKFQKLESKCKQPGGDIHNTYSQACRISLHTNNQCNRLNQSEAQFLNVPLPNRMPWARTSNISCRLRNGRL